MSNKNYISLEGLSIFYSKLKEWIINELSAKLNKDDVILSMGEEELLSIIHPIGSIYITNNPTNPSKLLGFGTWELTNKEFRTENGTGNADFFTPSENVESYTIDYLRIGQSLKLKIIFSPSVSISDSTIKIGTINFNALGISEIKWDLSSYAGGSDGGESVVLVNVKSSTGALSTVEVVEHSSGTMAAGSNTYFYIDMPIDYTCMLDDFCNMFYWMRIA